MTESEFRRFIESVEWRYAKTMPTMPHYYTLRAKCDSDQFVAAVVFIREHGQTERYRNKPYIYYYLDGYRYWTMGSPLDETILINRTNVY